MVSINSRSIGFDVRNGGSSRLHRRYHWFEWALYCRRPRSYRSYNNHFRSTFAFGGTEDLDLGTTPVSVCDGYIAYLRSLFTVTSNPLWSVGGFNFELGSLAVTNQATDSLALSGTGTLSKNGFRGHQWNLGCELQHFRHQLYLVVQHQ